MTQLTWQKQLFTNMQLVKSVCTFKVLFLKTYFNLLSWNNNLQRTSRCFNNFSFVYFITIETRFFSRSSAGKHPDYSNFIDIKEFCFNFIMLITTTEGLLVEPIGTPRSIKMSQY